MLRLSPPPPTGAQPPDDAKARAKAVREYGKSGGSEIIPKLETYLSDPDVDVRREAVKAIVDIGTQRSLDPLVKATRDNDPEIQIRATDGLVNFYVPGYVKTGLTAPLRRAGSSIKAKFTDTNDLVIDPYIQARPEVIAALGRVASGGASLEARANAARAAGHSARPPGAPGLGAGAALQGQRADLRGAGGDREDSRSKRRARTSRFCCTI